MASVLVPLAQGCEELEAVTVVDLLRRAGIDVVTAGLDEQPVRASRGMVLLPDMTLEQALQRDYDMIVLPGGLPGADHLRDDARVIDLLREMAAAGKYTAAICAAPRVLARAGLLDGKRATSYPGALDDCSGSRPRLPRAGSGHRWQRGDIARPRNRHGLCAATHRTAGGKNQRDTVEAGLQRNLIAAGRLVFVVTTAASA